MLYISGSDLFEKRKVGPYIGKKFEIGETVSGKTLRLLAGGKTLICGLALQFGAVNLNVNQNRWFRFNPIEDISTVNRAPTELKKTGIVYIHLVNHETMGAPPVPQGVTGAIRAAFGGTIILSGGYDAARAEADLKAGKGELVAFGRPFLSNPDLVERMATDAELNALDPATFYTPGEKGYTDFPTLAGKVYVKEVA